MSYSKSAEGSLEMLSHLCQDLQRKSARKLRDIAKLLREEQRKMNIAKVSFSSAGVVAGSLSIAGVILAPFTAGASIGLIVAGGGIGLAAGVGDVSTHVAEVTIIGNRVDEVQRILDHLAQTTVALLNRLRPQLEAFGISWTDVLRILFEAGIKGWDGYKLYTNIQKALDIARATTHAQQIAISLGGGDKVAKVVATVASAASSNPRLVEKAVDAVTNVTKVAGPIGSAIGIGFSIKAIVDNSIQIHRNVSDVADVIEKMANALSKPN